MRSYLSLVPISAKVHKRQSRMTRICIILAVFLVTSIFSMADMWTDAETTAMRHNHGDWHIALQNVSEDEAEQIRKNSGVAASNFLLSHPISEKKRCVSWESKRLSIITLTCSRLRIRFAFNFSAIAFASNFSLAK